MLSILFVLVALIGISPIWFSLYICFSSFQHILILAQFHNMFEKLIFFAAANSCESESVCCSVVSNSVTPWSIAHQAPLSVGFPRQEYWSGLPFHSPGDLSNSWIQPRSPTLQILYCLSHQVSPKIGTRDGTQDIFLWIPQGYNIVIQCYIGRDLRCYIDKIFTLGLGVWDEVIYIWPHSLSWGPTVWPLSWVATKTQARNQSFSEERRVVPYYYLEFVPCLQLSIFIIVVVDWEA